VQLQLYSLVRHCEGLLNSIKKNNNADQLVSPLLATNSRKWHQVKDSVKIYTRPTDADQLVSPLLATNSRKWHQVKDSVKIYTRPTDTALSPDTLIARQACCAYTAKHTHHVCFMMASLNTGGTDSYMALLLRTLFVQRSSTAR
jgi:hypothetical protein